MNFLGLTALTLLHDVFRRIETTTGTLLTPAKILLNDRATFDLLSRGQNMGVFQMESPGMSDACRGVSPRRIDDIIAMVALYRPGLMEFIPLYADRKSGRVPVKYGHPLLEPILQETYGIMVYQEQIMQAAHVLAGYTLGSADLLRRAMGRKNSEEMAKHRAIFAKSAAKTNSLKEAQANQLFDVLAEFAGNSFNKAHAACYGLLAYQTAYLKARYPRPFMSALLSSAAGDPRKIALIVQEATEMGIPRSAI